MRSAYRPIGLVLLLLTAADATLFAQDSPDGSQVFKPARCPNRSAAAAALW